MKLYKYLVYLIGFSAGCIGILGFIFTYVMMFFYEGVFYFEPNLSILIFQLILAIIGFICLCWIIWNINLEGEL